MILMLLISLGFILFFAVTTPLGLVPMAASMLFSFTLAKLFYKDIKYPSTPYALLVVNMVIGIALAKLVGYLTSFVFSMLYVAAIYMVSYSAVQLYLAKADENET